MNDKSPMDLARIAVYGSRHEDYGTPKENHARTAMFWRIYLGSRLTGVPLSPRDVCMMNILQKISRDVYSTKLDNLTDICGYAENAYLAERD